ncbi:MAG: hypothetical protein U5L09_22395 [Bacteroidales bacterium]|nr:hypothetical protein [Bacteroidales bacterium]
MVNEVKDIVDTCKWEYTIYEDEFPDDNNLEDSYNENIYGISFTPPGCETVSLCFLSNRKMSSPAHLKLYGKTNDSAEQKYLYMLSVKTQYAGVEIHKFIIELFRYLKKQAYFKNLDIIDEGKYWETGDEILLQEIFKQYVDLLGNFSFAIENIPINKGESYEKYFEKTDEYDAQ